MHLIVCLPGHDRYRMLRSGKPKAAGRCEETLCVGWHQKPSGQGEKIERTSFSRAGSTGRVFLRCSTTTTPVPTVAFTRNADGSFTTPPGYSKDLRKNADGTYTLTDRGSGTADTYDAGGRLTPSPPTAMVVSLTAWHTWTRRAPRRASS
ncbi:hypothetical protein SCALM49S_01958 [Streptomyces californicus]